MLTRGGCGEVVDRALHPIAPPIVPHRRHRVVVGGVRFQTLQAHPENRFRMALVEPDVIFRRLAQIVGIRTVVHDRAMIVIPARVGGGPSDDGEVVMGNFEPWPFSDLDVRGFRRWRRILSGDWAGAEQAAGRGGDRQFHDQSVHRTNPHRCSLGRGVWGSRAAPILSRSATGSASGPAPAGHRRYPSRMGIA